MQCNIYPATVMLGFHGFLAVVFLTCASAGRLLTSEMSCERALFRAPESSFPAWISQHDRRLRELGLFSSCGRSKLCGIVSAAVGFGKLDADRGFVVTESSIVADADLLSGDAANEIGRPREVLKEHGFPEIGQFHHLIEEGLRQKRVRARVRSWSAQGNGVPVEAFLGASNPGVVVLAMVTRWRGADPATGSASNEAGRHYVLLNDARFVQGVLRLDLLDFNEESPRLTAALKFEGRVEGFVSSCFSAKLTPNPDPGMFHRITDVVRVELKH